MTPTSQPLSLLAHRRRIFLASVVAFLVVAAALPMALTLLGGGWTRLKTIFFALFIILMAQVVFTAVVAVAGWWQLWRSPDPVQINNPAWLEAVAPLPDDADLPATAIVMPIYNEDVNRVFQGLRAMCQSLQETGRDGAFDFFILSDTSNTNCWMAEEKAWFELCKQVQGFGRIFYRRRRVQLHHKSGNIADFCRRWGASYRYMIVLDADSVMTGASFVQLVGLMEQRPQAGIIQTMTRPILGQSLFQRMEQFAAYVYRPLFAAGASFWQLGDATFWGHNAIVRLQPFMRYCAMPELPEVGPLGTQVLSHDTIEAALMRRGGYEVWQIITQAGSYEEGPPHLLASLRRDRRWCHGNMQHVWFLFERGLKMVSRFNILNGLMAYANSALWLLSLVLGVLVAMQQEASDLPGAPNSVMIQGILYACVMGLLLLPKVLGTMFLMRSPEKLRQCGGGIKVVLGVVAETLYSVLLAPVLMLFYTRFVLASFCGFKVGWGPQTRSDDKGPGWDAWTIVHGGNTIFALVATAAVIMEVPALLPWLMPVLIGPILAIPFSRFIASRGLGQRVKAWGWFVTPEEAEPPAELIKMAKPFVTARPPSRAQEFAADDYGLLQAVLDPGINAIHVSLLRQRTEGSPRTREYMALLADRLFRDGPLALTPAEKRTLLWDADTMLAMHQKLWNCPAPDLSDWWQTAFRHYVAASTLSTRQTAGI
jgi:membrane glycosyltransferase